MMKAHAGCKAWFALLLLLVTCLGCSVPEQEGKDPAVAPGIRGHQKHEEPLDPDLPLRAVSLRALQQVLAECVPKRACSEEILFFGRLTRILGYSLDRDNRDVLIYGLADPSLPPIHVDDFVVALRSSWLKYSQVEGHTYQYTYPGCDIRPEPALVLRLQEVGARLYSSGTPEEIETVLRSWRETCELPQDVSVLGVPSNTHFAHVMVTADYDMKRLADGSDHLDLPGMASVMDLELRTAEASLQQSQPVTLKTGMNRFWLTAGDQVYDEADGIMWIRSSPVRIQTRPIGADASGALSDTTGSDPSAEEFAHRFSLLYDKVAAQRPIYRELQSLFQIFAVTQALRFRNEPDEVGLDLSYLLESHPLSEFSVPRTVPGRHVVKQLQHESEIPGGTQIAQLWMPSCGGVEMRIEPQESQFSRGHNESLGLLQKKMKEARPESNPSVWNVALAENLRAGTEQRLENQKNNRPGSPMVVTIEDRGSHYYTVVGGTELQMRPEESLNAQVLLHELKQWQRQQKGTDTFYFNLKGFTDHGASGFASTCKHHHSLLGHQSEIHIFRDVGSPTLEKLSTPGITKVGEIKPAQKIKKGPLRGMFKATITFLVWVGGVLHKVTITVLGTSAEVVDTYLETMNLEFRFSDSLPLSFIDLRERTHRKLERKYKEDVRIQIEEGGYILFVHLKGIQQEHAA